MDITATASVLELGWTMIAFIGTITAGVFAYDAYRDRLVLYAANEGDSARMELAMGHQINALAKAAALALHTVIGVAAMAVSNRSSAFGTLIAVCFILAEFFLVFALVRNHRARKKVLSDEQDMATERLRHATAAAALTLELNTRAVQENTEVMRTLTDQTQHLEDRIE
jgi:hypothetical protein